MTVHVQFQLSTCSSQDGPPHRKHHYLLCTTTSLERTPLLLIAVQWSMDYADALHRPEFHVVIQVTLSVGELLGRWPLDGYKRYIEIHPEYVYSVSRRFQIHSATP